MNDDLRLCYDCYQLSDFTNGQCNKCSRTHFSYSVKKPEYVSVKENNIFLQAVRRVPIVRDPVRIEKPNYICEYCGKEYYERISLLMHNKHCFTFKR